MLRISTIIAAVIHSPATAGLGTDPSGRTGIQAFVDDRRLDQQARAQDSKNWTIPFSGIGDAARRGRDNRSHDQKLRDEAWWDNFHRCERGKC